MPQAVSERPARTQQDRRSFGLARLQAALQPTPLASHYAPLHGLRVIGIIMVVQIHATEPLFRLGVLTFTSASLWFCMDLFFFLSGFLIGSMLLAESSSGRRLDMLRFYARRSFRIVPSYFVVLTALAFLTPVPRKNLLWEYLYLTNYVPGLPESVSMPWAWSLAVEEHFYILVPALVVVLRRLRSPRAQLWLLFGLWLSGLAVRAWKFVVDGPSPPMIAIMYVQSHLRYDILIAGIFTAYVQRHYRAGLAQYFARPLPRWLVAGAAVFFLALVFGTQNFRIFIPGYSVLLMGTLTSLAYVPLVLFLLNYDSGLSRLFSQRIFLWIATFGYGIYLIHVPVITSLAVPGCMSVARWLVLDPLQTWMIVLGASFGLSTLGAYLLHLLIEKPALRLRDRLCP